jgi:small GTP-binding protein
VVETAIADCQFARNLLRPHSICLVGAVNTGKSTLLNALAGGERVLSDATPGTTRDAVSEFLDLGGYAVECVDTAGFGAGQSALDARAEERTRCRIAGADAVFLLLDASRPLSEADRAAALAVRACRNAASGESALVYNKCDLPPRLNREEARELLPGADFVSICARNENSGLRFADFCVTLCGGRWDGAPLPWEEAHETALRRLVSLISSENPTALDSAWGALY